MKFGIQKVKGSKLRAMSSPSGGNRGLMCRVKSWVGTMCRVIPKSCNFLALRSFCILAITSSTNLQLCWFKFHWKSNSQGWLFRRTEGLQWGSILRMIPALWKKHCRQSLLNATEASFLWYIFIQQWWGQFLGGVTGHQALPSAVLAVREAWLHRPLLVK